VLGRRHEIRQWQPDVLASQLRVPFCHRPRQLDFSNDVPQIAPVDFERHRLPQMASFFF
jgi:hypothetical protein